MRKQTGKKFKKGTALILSAVMISSLICGCGKPAAETVTTASVPETEISELPETLSSGKTNEYGWEIPDETMEITFYHTDRYDPDKNEKTSQRMHDYLLENFNVDLTRIVYDVDSKERLNLMLASDDYPELIVGMDKETFSLWKDQGRVIDMAPYIDEYGSEIREALGDYYNRYVDADGAVYALPRGWGIFPIPDYSAAIRYDWYTQMGSPEMKTPEDYFNVLSDMVAAHPTNPAGEKVYAMSWNQTSTTNFLDTLNAYLGIWGLKEGYKDDAEHNLTHWLNTEEGLKAVTYLNQYTVAGLMDPDAFINTYEDWAQKFSNERILGNINSWSQIWSAGHEVWQKTWDDWNDDQRFIQIALKDESAEASYMTAKDSYGWNYVVITDKCKDPAKIMKWMNFNLSPIGEKLLCWGVPNEEGDSIWHYDGDGNWHWDETRKADLFNGTLNYDTYDLLGGWKYSFLEGAEPMRDDGSCIWYDQNFNNEIKWKKVIHDNMSGTIYDNTAARQVVFSAANPLSVTKQQIDDAIVTGFAKCVMSPSLEECIANFNDLRDSLNKAGLHDIEEYRSSEYKRILKGWKE